MDHGPESILILIAVIVVLALASGHRRASGETWSSGGNKPGNPLATLIAGILAIIILLAIFGNW